MLKLITRINPTSSFNISKRLFCHKRVICESLENLKFPSKVPVKPIPQIYATAQKVTITDEEIQLLERLSLVDLSSKYV